MALASLGDTEMHEVISRLEGGHIAQIIVRRGIEACTEAEWQSTFDHPHPSSTAPGIKCPPATTGMQLNP
jgi:hypothetical protein